ncbi:MAG: hypothetical protein ACFFBP_00910 [Promethearchaeota archaeon]
MVDRPKGINIWIIVEIITAISLIIFAILCLTGIAFQYYNTNIQANLESLLAPLAVMRLDQLILFMFTETMFFLYGILFLLLGLSFLASAVLLYMMKELGRLLSVFNGVFILLSIVGLILGILMIWYFRRSKTRSYFP